MGDDKTWREVEGTNAAYNSTSFVVEWEKGLDRYQNKITGMMGNLP